MARHRISLGRVPTDLVTVEQVSSRRPRLTGSDIVTADPGFNLYLVGQHGRREMYVVVAADAADVMRALIRLSRSEPVQEFTRKNCHVRRLQRHVLGPRRVLGRIQLEHGRS